MVEQEEKEHNTLKERLKSLKIELENKEKENFSLLDKIERLEDSIIKYEKIIEDSKSDADENIKAKAVESKLKIEIEDRDRQIRELKDKMGFLRKDKIGLQRELENLKKQQTSSVIKIEEKPPHLESLV